MSTEDASKLFVAGLPDSVTEDVLRQLFEATGGTVVNVSLPKDRATGRPRGFGFVTLSTPEEANSARQSLDGSMQAGRSISVRPFSAEPPRRNDARGESPGAASEDRTLYIGNLPYDVTQAEVERVFADNAAGPVVRVHLPMGPDGRPRGFGFVTLASADAATSAVVALRNVDVRGRRLTVNIAHPRGERGASSERPDRADRGVDRGDRGPRPSRPPPGMSEPRFDSPERDPDAGLESARPVEGRRARVAPEGAAAKKKKNKAGRRTERIEEERRRGGGGSWRKLADWDED